MSEIMKGDNLTVQIPISAVGSPVHDEKGNIVGKVIKVTISLSGEPTSFECKIFDPEIIEKLKDQTRDVSIGYGRSPIEKAFPIFKQMEKLEKAERELEKENIVNFSVNQHVRHKAEKWVGTVVEVNGENVTIAIWGQLRVYSSSDFDVVEPKVIWEKVISKPTMDEIIATPDGRMSSAERSFYEKYNLTPGEFLDEIGKQYSRELMQEEIKQINEAMITEAGKPALPDAKASALLNKLTEATVNDSKFLLRLYREDWRFRKFIDAEKNAELFRGNLK
jgi:hypothetical protein